MNAAPTTPALANDAQRGSHWQQRMVGRHSERLQYWRDRYRKNNPLKEKTCLECRSKFMPVKSDQKFHSRACAAKFHNRKYWANPEIRKLQTIKFRAWRRKPENLERMRNHIKKWREIPGNRSKQLAKQKIQSENLDDGYITNMLRLPKMKTPLGLIAVKRVCLKTKRLIKTLKPKLT